MDAAFSRIAMPNTQSEILNQTLCSSCRKIVSWIAHPSFVVKQDSWSTSFSLIEETAERGCRLCVLFLSVFSVYEKAQIRSYLEVRKSEPPRVTIRWRDSSLLGFTFHPGPPNFQIEKHFQIIEACHVRTPVITPVSLSGFSRGDGISCYAALDRARLWLRVCDDAHRPCLQNNKSFVPTRLIYVGTIKKPRCRVLESLRGTRALRYMTLSHCWGDVPQKRLTIDNRSELMKFIATEELSKTFQDAISITRELGIQYLWIDSLCIVQDSYTDWGIESAQMYRIYSSSYCNLAASSARDGSEGMLCYRDFNSLQPLTLFIFDRVCHIEPTVKSVFEASVERSPLMNRAWVFQERMLSRRNLHFTTAGLLWECNSHSTFEQSLSVNRGPCKRNVPLLPPDYSNDFVSYKDPHSTQVRLATSTNTLTSPLKYHTAEVNNRTDGLVVSASLVETRSQGLTVKLLYSMWDSLVDDYSTTKLTKHTDKLVALSGLAESWQQQIHDEYLAGLWRMNLSRNLLWCVAILPEFHEQPQRPAEYVAPSWSWASIIGPVMTLPTYTKIHKNLVAASDVSMKTRGPKPFGQLLGGYIDFYGRIACVEVTAASLYQEKGSPNTFLIPLRDTAVFAEGYVSVSIDVAADDVPTVEAVNWYLMPLGLCNEYNSHARPYRPLLLGLVLQKIKPNSNYFRRLGRFRCGGSSAETKIYEISIACQSFDEHANQTGLDYRLDEAGYYQYLIRVF